jgi:uncharacterized protein YcsI (UPF0317 family)
MCALHVDINAPRSVREAIRHGGWSGPTSGICPGYLQANMVILHKELAADFETFCRQNPGPCPLLAVLPPGCKEPTELAPGADITTDLPKYRIYRNGRFTEEVTDIKDVWSDEMVVFLIGCSFSFEGHLQKAGVPVRNIEQRRNVSMYITSTQCTASGFFDCPLVVSYRPVPSHLVEKAVQVTKQYGTAHGPPVHIGDHSEIGIEDLERPDFGDAVKAEEGDVGMFWACGVTSTLAAISNPKASLVITHAPGHMFLTDKTEFND